VARLHDDLGADADLGRAAVDAVEHTALDLPARDAGLDDDPRVMDPRASTAASRSAQSVTFVMPTLEPARQGLTNSGSASRSRMPSSAACSCRSHSRGVMTTYGPMGRPCAANSAFMCPLSIAAAEAKTPEPT
jgi:hypothetical protein